MGPGSLCPVRGSKADHLWASYFYTFLAEFGFLMAGLVPVATFHLLGLECLYCFPRGGFLGAFVPDMFFVPSVVLFGFSGVAAFALMMFTVFVAQFAVY